MEIKRLQSLAETLRTVLIVGNIIFNGFQMHTWYFKASQYNTPVLHVIES